MNLLATIFPKPAKPVAIPSLLCTEHALRFGAAMKPEQAVEAAREREQIRRELRKELVNTGNVHRRMPLAFRSQMLREALEAYEEAQKEVTIP